MGLFSKTRPVTAARSKNWQNVVTVYTNLSCAIYPLITVFRRLVTSQYVTVTEVLLFYCLLKLPKIETHGDIKIYKN